ncbi:MAG: 4-(cytidine 5'-diphospho)-2-C-methyl-D-erythritol kinase [Erysipelotrichaceae bacterium]
MKLQANAKINLALDVVTRLDNGYHDLDMIMMPLALHDEIELSCSDDMQYVIDGSDLAMDEHNTIVKAVNLMKATFAIEQNFHIKVTKHIPMQAGLAGGSADAAAVLRGINSLLNLGLGIETLASLGKQIGADVPFCVYNTCARVKGIGEKIRPISNTLQTHVLLVKPNVGVSTPEAFRTLDFTTLHHPDIDAMEQALTNRDWDALVATTGNSLEQSAFVLAPSVAQIKQELQELGFSYVLMSGSGSTVFALSNDVKLLEEARVKYECQGLFSTVTAFI